MDFERVPFQEAIAHFRQKQNIPTERWDDIAGAEHDVAFVVAGAAKADLLADLRAAVDKAVEEGKTRKEFAADFDSIVERRGWSHTGDRAWRADIIFQTNVRSAHAAGRWEQLQALKESRPYWQWVHGDSVEPRPEHRALDGKIFPADSEFWQSMFPPSGYGCKCQVVSLSKAEVKAEGLEVEEPPPPNPDRGFESAPGASRKEQRAQILKQIKARLPESLRQELDRDLEIQAYDQPIDKPRNAIDAIAELLGIEITGEQRAAILERLGDNPTRGKITAILLEIRGK